MFDPGRQVNALWQSVLKQLTEVRYIVFEINEPRVANRYLWVSHLCLFLSHPYTHSDSRPPAWSTFQTPVSFPVLCYQFSFLHDQNGCSVIFNNTFTPLKTSGILLMLNNFFLCKRKSTSLHSAPPSLSIVNRQYSNYGRLLLLWHDALTSAIKSMRSGRQRQLRLNQLV